MKAEQDHRQFYPEIRNTDRWDIKEDKIHANMIK